MALISRFALVAAIGSMSSVALAQTDYNRHTTTITEAAPVASQNVVRARYIKPGDVSPEEYQRLLDEADRIKAFQGSTSSKVIYNDSSESLNTPTYTASQDYTSATPTYGSTSYTGSSYSGASTTTYATTSAAVPTYSSEAYSYAPSSTTTSTTYTAPATSYTYADTSTYTAPATTSTYTAPAESNYASYTAQSHSVAKGDTLYNISKRYGVTVASLKSANGLNGNTIRLGQTLSIPGAATSSYAVTSTPYTSSFSTTYASATTTPSTSYSSGVYAVLPSDTLYSISRYACVTVDALAQANNIIDPSLLQPGQQLVMPAGHCLR